jgi:hypothetical protein
MTLQEFSRDVVPILQASFTFLGLGILIVVWWQVRQTSRWNKLQAAQAFINHNTNVYESDVIKAGKAAGLELKARTTPLTDDEVESVVATDEIYLAAMTVLTDMECTCTAINAGIVDGEVAYSVHSSRLTQAYKLYLPLINRLRAIHDDEAIYIEFEKTVRKIEDQLTKQRRANLRTSGVSPRI